MCTYKILLYGTSVIGIFTVSIYSLIEKIVASEHPANPNIDISKVKHMLIVSKSYV
jgi:hypothetical protein